MHTRTAARPTHFVQEVLFPPSCVRAELTIHQEPSAPGYGLTIEVRDPHTDELLALECIPVKSSASPRGVARDVAADLRTLLAAVLDPEPF